MKKSLVRKAVLLSFFILINTLAVAQQFVSTGDFDRLSKASIGFGLNTYLGELRRISDSRFQSAPSVSVGYEHLFTDNIAIRTSFSIYTIQADDSLSPIAANKLRNINFKATNAEFVVQALYYAFRHPSSGYKDRAFANPYFHLGLGVTSNNPTAELAGTEYKLRPLALEGVQYGGIAVAIPLGVGANVYVSKNFDIQFEMQYTIALTGYLDDVSGVYRDPSSFSDTDGIDAATLGLLSDPRAALTPPVAPVSAGTVRGDNSNDGYLRFGFRLGYYLPKSLYGKSSIRCKVVKRTR